MEISYGYFAKFTVIMFGDGRMLNHEDHKQQKEEKFFISTHFLALTMYRWD